MKKKYLLTKEEKINFFGEGEWADEPEQVNFEHNGIECRVQRTWILRPNGCYGGHLCGYCKLPENLNETQIDELLDDIGIHGGITFNEEGWIGFDCAHMTDIVPSIELLKKNIDELKELYSLFKYPISERTYKNIYFVIEETKSLANQIKEYCELLP